MIAATRWQCKRSTAVVVTYLHNLLLQILRNGVRQEVCAAPACAETFRLDACRHALRVQASAHRADGAGAASNASAVETEAAAESDASDVGGEGDEGDEGDAAADGGEDGSVETTSNDDADGGEGDADEPEAEIESSSPAQSESESEERASRGKRKRGIEDDDFYSGAAVSSPGSSLSSAEGRPLKQQRKQ